MSGQGGLQSYLGSAAQSTANVRDVITRIFVVRDCWQSIALFLVGFSWPSIFHQWIGTVASVLALKFTIALQVSYVSTYYFLVALSFASFLLLTLLALTDKMQSAEDVAAQLAHVAQERREARARGEAYASKRSGRSLAAWLSLFILSSLYIPVTTSVVEVLTCHPNVQCVFDCYNTAEYWAAFYTGLVAGVLITVVTPVIMFIVTMQVTSGYQGYLKAKFGDATLVRLERHWHEYIEAMNSAYNSIYEPYHYRYAFMGTFTNIVKATLCFVTLGLPPDTSPQIIAIIVTQSVFAAVVFLVAPFRNRVCNWILQLSQGYVVVAVAIACIYRINPDQTFVFGTILNALAIVTGAVQLLSMFSR